MHTNKAIVVISALFLLLAGLNIAFAGDENIVEGPPIMGVNSEPEMQWVWGEVILVDPINNKVSIKYLDYDTDTEKELNILTSTETAYDNLDSLEELKPQDTISVDYIVDAATGANVARNISIEKPQEYEDVSIEENLIIAPDTETLPNAGEPARTE